MSSDTITTTPPTEQGSSTITTSASVDATLAEKVAQDTERLEQESTKELKAFRQCYAKGSKAQAAAHITSGKHAARYGTLQTELGRARKTWCDTLEHEMRLSGADTRAKIDVSELIRTSAAHYLYAVDPDTVVLPFSTLRDTFARLVERVGRTETFVVLPGLEIECKAVYTDAVEKGLRTADLVDRVNTLCRQRADAQAADAREKAKAATAEQEQAATAKAATAQELAAAEKAAQDAKAAADTAKADEKATLTANMEQAKATLLAAQAAHIERVEREAQAERERIKAAQDVEYKAKVAKNAADKAAGVKKQPSATSGKGTNILATLAKATPKDAAEQIATAIAGHEDPVALLYDVVQALAAKFATLPGCGADDLYMEITKAVRDSQSVGKCSHQAAQAAMIQLVKVAKAS